MKINKIFRYTACAFSPHDDDLPTEDWSSGGGLEDDLETQVPGGKGGGFSSSDNDETQIGRGGFVDEFDSTMLDDPEIGTLGILWVVDGVRRGKIYKIRDGDILGKREGDLYLDDPKVSTPHCRFRIEKKKFVLWDCGSKNGTFVNNKAIRCATTLKENDLVKIGDNTFVFKMIT